MLRLSEQQFRQIRGTSMPNLSVLEGYDLASHVVSALEMAAIHRLDSPLVATLNIGLKSLDRGDGSQKPYERMEQAISLVWLYCHHPEAFSMTTATPMGGYRPNGAGGQMKGEGARSGYPDLLMDLPMREFHGLRIEMKKFCPTAKPSADQDEWLERLARHGYSAVLCRGHQAAIQVMAHYLDVALPKADLPAWAVEYY